MVAENSASCDTESSEISFLHPAINIVNNARKTNKNRKEFFKIFIKNFTPDFQRRTLSNVYIHYDNA